MRDPIEEFLVVWVVASIFLFIGGAMVAIFAIVLRFKFGADFADGPPLWGALFGTSACVLSAWLGQSLRARNKRCWRSSRASEP